MKRRHPLSTPRLSLFGFSDFLRRGGRRMEVDNPSPSADRADPQPCSSSSLQQPRSEVDNGNGWVQEGTVFDFERKPHPLLLPNVIRDILNYLKVEELKSLRLVCTGWNEEACKLTQLKSTVTFLDSEAISKYMLSFCPEAPALPHSKYQFYNVDLFSNTILDEFFGSFGSQIKNLLFQQKIIPERDLYRILSTYAPNVESLTLRSPPSLLRGKQVLFQRERMADIEASNRLELLRGHKKPPEVEEEEPADWLDCSFPSIRHFTIGSYNDGLVSGGGGGHGPEGGDGEDLAPLDEGADWATRSRPLVRLLRALPNLATVSLSTLDGPRQPQFSAAVLRCLIDAGPEPLRNLTLVNFPIELGTEAAAVGLLRLQLLHLSSLDLTLDPAVESATLIALLSVVGDSLSRLSLSFQPNYPYGYNFMRIPGGHLNHLRHLRLNRFKWSLNFIESLSALRSLTLCDMDLGPIFPIRFRTLHRHLEVLKVVTGELRILLNDSEVVSRITRAFPNLQVLHLPGATDDCLRPIYTELAFLVELNCTVGAFTDCGISGVPLEVCNDLVETQTFNGVNADKFRSNLFIGNLTNLVRLTLESEKMTDLSILFGVIRCPKLKTLCLKSPLITDLGVESITDQMGPFMQSLNVLDCPGVTEAGRFFATERYPGRQFLVPEDDGPGAQPSEESRARHRHRIYDTFSRRRGAGKLQEVTAMMRHYRSGRFRRPAQFHHIQERIADLAGELPPEHLVDLREQLQALQRQHHEEPIPPPADLPPLGPGPEGGVEVPIPEPLGPLEPPQVELNGIIEEEVEEEEDREEVLRALWRDADMEDWARRCADLDFEREEFESDSD